jgi:D-alanyl-D-alanine carboxypeptidase
MGQLSRRRWMADNAWRFGFVLSYPKGRSDQTCYAYEPWHYRYFGRDLAAKIHASGLTTREYLWRAEHQLAVPASP